MVSTSGSSGMCLSVQKLIARRQLPNDLLFNDSYWDSDLLQEAGGLMLGGIFGGGLKLRVT